MTSGPLEQTWPSTQQTPPQSFRDAERTVRRLVATTRNAGKRRRPRPSSWRRTRRRARRRTHPTRRPRSRGRRRSPPRCRTGRRTAPTSRRLTSTARPAPPDASHSEGTEVEVVGDDRARPPGREHRLLGDLGGRRRQRGEDRRRCGTSGRRGATKISSQSITPRRIWLAAELARSEQPTAARGPKPRSVKLSPLRTERPMPS